MVQEIAKKSDPYGKEGRGSGSLLHSSEGGVPGFLMRVGDERRFVQSFPFGGHDGYD